jgi:hypothetical protein
LLYGKRFQQQRVFGPKRERLRHHHHHGHCLSATGSDWVDRHDGLFQPNQPELDGSFRGNQLFCLRGEHSDGHDELDFLQQYRVGLWVYLLLHRHGFKQRRHLSSKCGRVRHHDVHCLCSADAHGVDRHRRLLKPDQFELEFFVRRDGLLGLSERGISRHHDDDHLFHHWVIGQHDLLLYGGRL